MDIFVSTIVCFLGQFSPEFLSLLTFLVCGVVLLFFVRYFGAPGLYVYNSIAIVVANIQVLRLAKFSFSPEPMALGTVVFATTFLASDILAEHYGAKAARQALALSFLSQIFVTTLMILTLGHPSLDDPLSSNPISVDRAMTTLFVPSLRFLWASLIAYAISQLFDIWLFQKIRELSQSRFLWLRQNVSTLLSGLLDNFIFSIIAWVILNPTPIDYYTLMVSYVFGSYLLRFLVNLGGTPVMYLSYYMHSKQTLTH
ncbi:MAG: queuosine precursor transporter [Alphaproteobacteria bacterium]|nr:queuosine precursor transporter [Alphaproteobacteria bacterium]